MHAKTTCHATRKYSIDIFFCFHAISYAFVTILVKRFKTFVELTMKWHFMFFLFLLTWNVMYAYIKQLVISTTCIYPTFELKSRRWYKRIFDNNFLHHFMYSSSKQQANSCSKANHIRIHMKIPSKHLKENEKCFSKCNYQG